MSNSILGDLAEVWLLDSSPAYRSYKTTALYVQLGIFAIVGGAVVYIAATGLQPTPDPMKKFAPTK
jgi:hypothetical protein